MLIGGEWRTSAPADHFVVTDPATGAVVGSVPEASRSDIEHAIHAADRAVGLLREITAADRRRVLLAAAEMLRNRRDRIAAILTSEQGKPLAEAAAEVNYAAGFFDWFAGEAERIYGQIVPPPRTDKRILVVRQAVGVTGAITPWNFPAAMLTRKLGPAIAAGCATIVKPAEATPLTAVEICRVLFDCGLPPGAINLVTSSRPAMVADVLFGDPRVRKISFTGSTAVGKELIRRSADCVQRLSLELGGHAPFIVFDDADIDEAVNQVVASKFRNAGQTCICANRIFVQRGIYKRFLETLTARTSALVVGPGTRDGVDIGPLIDDDAIRKVERHVEDATSRGARITTGGTRLRDREFANGHFFAPTVLDGITPDMLLSTEETFGPVAGLASFATEQEIIRAANATPYGLAAYVQTRDYARIFRLADELNYGVIGINDGAPSNPAAPFGGMKESGFGREGGAPGIDEYLNVKFVSIGGVQEGTDARH